ncbi:MAG: type I methionyl aminopeptidase [Propionibacteriaceae bacterium]|nr:type I methionyl aminopeptidase [Propionibacteriaceae bacterium]
MRRAGLVVAEGLAAMGAAAVPGATTGDLDAIGRETLAEAGARSNFLNYGPEFGYPPYPGVACISVNEMVVHGIPGPLVLREGDIVSIDFGAIVDGWHGDAARTFLVGGHSSDEATALVEATRESMWAGIAAIKPGAHIGDVSYAVERSIRSHKPVRYGIVREYTGHGIGTAMHQPPDIPNWGKPRTGPRISKGMVLCVEPMLTLGTDRVVELADGWSVRTADNTWAAHWENTTAVLPDGLWVLTEPDGGQAELTARGLSYSPLD